MIHVSPHLPPARCCEDCSRASKVCCEAFRREGSQESGGKGIQDKKDSMVVFSF